MRNSKPAFVFLGLALLGAACTPGKVTGDADGGVWVRASGESGWERRSTIYQDRVSTKTIDEVNVKKFVFSPTDPRKVFLVSYQSGLWFSWKEGYFWDLVLPATVVSDLAIHPTNPSRLYAAVGSTVALSLDEGMHWRSTYQSDATSTVVTSVVVNPDVPSTVYAARSDGNVLISEDSGISWRVHASLGAGVVLENVQFHPQQRNTMYALVSGAGLARSRDAGKTWEFFTDAFSSYSGANEARDYALVPSGIVYASRYGLLRSLNHGTDWTSLPLISLSRGSGDANVYALAVNPENPLEIFYGTASTLYQSVDGGFNWIPRPLPSTRRASALAFYPGDPNLLFLGVTVPRN